jgi:hypothetical protein
MLTGGFRSAEGMNAALASGACDVIGVARSLAIQPDFPNQLLSGASVTSQVKPLTTGWKFLDKTFPLEIIWYTDQLHLMGEGKEPNLKKSALGSVWSMVYKLGKNSLKKVR